MKKLNKKFAAGIGGAGLMALAIFGSVNAASVPTTATASSRPTKEINSATHAAIETALTNDDYAAFTAAISAQPKPADAVEITEAVFEQMVEANKLRAAGDTAGAEAIMTSLGFKKHEGGRGGPGMANLTDAQKTALDQARALMEAGNKTGADAVLKAAGITFPDHGPRDGGGTPPNLTDAQKAAFTQAKALRDAGDETGAKAVLDAAGIKAPEGRGMGRKPTAATTTTTTQ